MKYLSDKEAEEIIEILVSENGYTRDEAVHTLVDAGDINSTQHAELLTPKERERVYGE